MKIYHSKEYLINQLKTKTPTQIAIENNVSPKTIQNILCKLKLANPKKFLVKIKIKLLGTKEFLISLQNKLFLKLNLQKHKIKKHRNIFFFEYYGNDARKFCYWIYKGSQSLFLKRKYDRFVNHIQLRGKQ